MARCCCRPAPASGIDFDEKAVKRYALNPQEPWITIR